VAGELLHRSALPDRFQWRALVLCFAAVSNVDTTALQALEEVIAQCHASGVPLVIATANAMVEETLGTAGLVEKLGGQKFLARRVHEAVRLVLLRELPKPPGLVVAAETDSATGASEHGGPAPVARTGNWWSRVVACWPGHRVVSAGGGVVAGSPLPAVPLLPRAHLPSDPGAPASPSGSGDLALRA